MAEPIVVTGRVGWRNSADSRTTSQLDVYGPQGRWGGPERQGQALIDALVDQGAGEGDRLVVVVVPRGAEEPYVTAVVREALEDAGVDGG